MEESVHVKFDEFRIEGDNLDDCEVEELTKDKEDTQEVGEWNVEPVEEPGPLVTSPDTRSHPTNEIEGDSDADREEEITRKSRWKHQSSHPLDNLISPLDSGIQTRPKARIFVTY